MFSNKFLAIDQLLSMLKTGKNCTTKGQIHKDITMKDAENLNIPDTTNAKIGKTISNYHQADKNIVESWDQVSKHHWNSLLIFKVLLLPVI